MHSLRKGMWVSGAIATNPSGGDIIVTTGALYGGWYLLSVNLHASVDTVIVMAQRNADDDGDVLSYEIPVPADQDVPMQIPIQIHIHGNERFSLRMKSGITGTAQGSIFYANVVG